MSDNTKEVKEIDLLELFRLTAREVKKLILWILKALIFLIGFGLKKILFILLFGAIGAGVGFLLYTTSPRYYSSDMIAQPNGITSIDMVSYMNDLTELCKHKNTSALSHALNLDDSITKRIKNIQAYHYIDVNGDGIGDYVDFNQTFNATDTTKRIVESPVHVQIELFDISGFSTVKKALLTYIEGNPYHINLNKIRKVELNELIDQSIQEIAKLDSLQDVEYFRQKNSNSRSKSSNVLFLAETNQHMYYQDKLLLLEKKQNFMRELQLATTPITIIKYFSELTPKETNKLNYLSKYITHAILLGYFLLLFTSKKSVLYHFVVNQKIN